MSGRTEGGATGAGESDPVKELGANFSAGERQLLAFARALATAEPLEGAGLTLVFGLGTLPAMLGLTLAAPALRRSQSLPARPS